MPEPPGWPLRENPDEPGDLPPRARRAEPTPWATGLTVTAMVAALAAVLDIILTTALARSFGWLAVPANVLIGAGVAPSLWLMRRLPFWRWIGYGIGVGLALAWLGLLIEAIFGATAA